MECSCISADVDNFSDVLFEKDLTAKVKHICYECLKEIEIGEAHHFEKTEFEGNFNEYRTCLDCMSVREHLVCEFYYGQIWELVDNELSQYPDDIPWSKIGRLTPAARNRVCEIIERNWDEE